MPRIPEEAQNQCKKYNAQHADSEDGPEPCLVVHHSQKEVAVLVLVGNQGKGRCRQRKNGYQTVGPPEVCCLVLQGHGSGTTQNQQGHVIPAGIVTGIECVEQAVQPWHQCTDQTDFQQDRKRMAPALATEGKPACDAHNRQISGHAGPFQNTAVEHIVQIGSIRCQEHAVQDCQILLGISIDQISIASKGINGSGIL